MVSKKILIGIRGKLVIIFILIKVIPLILLAWIAWKDVDFLGKDVSNQTTEMTKDMQNVVTEVGNKVIKDSISALDLRSREAIERMTTDTAKAIADFLYQRDEDIRHVAGIEINEESFKHFLSTHTQFVTKHEEWILSPDVNSWIPKQKPHQTDTIVTALLEDNKEFRYRVPEKLKNRVKRPMYLEMTFVNPDGMEKLKVTTGNLLPSELRDISKKENTWCKAETYFQYLKDLKPGEIYVSDVIGAYVGSKIIGNYTPDAAKKKGIPFEPEKDAYAGKENPAGIRFQGLIRWATPVEKDGNIIGYITLALDHTHIMEFSDYILPTEERYTSNSDASSGNYAFIFNYNSQCISHPRDYYIVGYEPETGEPAPFWMDQEMYNQWKKSGLKISEFMKQFPLFHEQSFKKKPASEQIKAGTLGLDVRFLNFTPQGTDWDNLTRYGGSGSFVNLWSGLWKLYTIAAIPYYTGQYGKTPRGFGYAAMCANVDEFHRPALETKDHIDKIVKGYENEIRKKQQAVENMIGSNIRKTTKNLFFYTVIMILFIIGIAVWMASVITNRIKNMINGIQCFQEGELSYRLKMNSSDEIGMLGDAFDSMADSIEESYKKSEVYIDKLKKAEEKYRSIFENAIEGIYQSMPNGKFRSANPALASILGYDSPEDLMQNVTSIGEQLYVNPESRSEVYRLLREHGIVRGFETQFYRKDGSRIWVSLNTRPVYDENGELLHVEGMLEDITQRKEKEELEKTYKARLEKDVEERTRELSETLENLKAAQNELIRSEKMAALGQLIAGIAHEINTPLGAVCSSVTNISKILDQTLNTLPAFFRHLPDEYHDPFFELIEKSLQKNMSISSKEERKLRRSLIRSMDEHSLQNADTLADILVDMGIYDNIEPFLPIFKSSENLSVLQMAYKLSGLHRSTQTITTAADRASKIVFALKNFARFDSSGEAVRANIADGIETVLTLYHNQIKTGVEIIRNYGELPLILCYPDELNQVWTNLIHNALQAMENKGVLTIALSQKENRIIIDITDTGKGIPAEIKDKIFEPFFTTKPAGEGSGLGLDIARRIIEKHHGEITVQSEPGNTAFSVLLPVS